MKNIILIVIIAFSILNCQAQTVGLETKIKDVPAGAYVKDLNNEMNKYVGRWQYVNASDTLTIVIQKKSHIFNDVYFEDLLIGEYSFTSNGIEIVNTLPLLNDTTNLNYEQSNILGNFLINRDIWYKCLECGLNEKRFALGFWDPERTYLTSTKIILRILPLESTGNGNTSSIRMLVTILATHGVSIPTEDSPASPRVPYGEYLMIKQ